MTCSKPLHGTEVKHQTNHGPVFNWAGASMADPWWITDAVHQATSSSAALAAPCSEICSLYGPGHRHIPHYGGGTLQPHAVSHVDFWEQIKFDDPYSAEAMEKFAKCSIPCDHLSHRSHEKDRPLCQREIFHGNLYTDLVPHGNRLSRQYCLLSCTHKCLAEECEFKDVSNSCEGKCDLDYQHGNGHRCSAVKHICNDFCLECQKKKKKKKKKKKTPCIVVLDSPASSHHHRCETH